MLANGTIAETYVDSLDDLKALSPIPPVSPEPEAGIAASEAQPADVSPVPPSGTGEERPLFARYPMPGHGRD